MNRLVLNSVPRSGSTWLGSIIDSSPNVAYRYQPLFSYAFKDALSEESSQKEILDFFDKIYNSDDPFLNQVEDKQKGKVPTFRKEQITTTVYKEVRYQNILANLLEKDKDLQAILLIRNPKAVISSWLSAPREFRSDLGWREMEEWRWAPKKNLGKKEEYNGFEKWKEATNLFHRLLERFSDRVLIVKYSNLLNNTMNEVERIFQFMNLPITNQTVSFLNSSKRIHSNDSYSVYKTKKNDESWKERLNPNIIQSIDSDLKGTELEKYLY